MKSLSSRTRGMAPNTGSLSRFGSVTVLFCFDTSSLSVSVSVSDGKYDDLGFVRDVLVTATEGDGPFTTHSGGGVDDGALLRCCCCCCLRWRRCSKTGILDDAGGTFADAVAIAVGVGAVAGGIDLKVGCWFGRPVGSRGPADSDRYSDGRP